MGSDYMVAPIYVPNATSRSVHFPDDGVSGWKHHFSGEVYKGGTKAMVPAAIDTFPLFQKVPAVSSIASSD
jgi:alpha-D-xyloside xylohydrolase